MRETQRVEMAEIFPHQKQYVLGPKPIAIRPDWISHRLSDVLVLSHCPRLRAADLRTSDGVTFILLGLAVLADPAETRAIADASSSRTSSEIEEWTSCWAGRWLLISERACYQDASGQIGLCTRRVGAELWISSSPAILGDHLPGARPAPRLPWQIAHAQGMDWIPAPLTTRDGVLRVLPMRVLDPRNGSIRPVRYAPPTGEGIGQLAEYLKTVMVNWTRTGFREHFVGLTAGLDTRTVLAAAAGAGIEFQTYTTKYPFIAAADAALPPRLAARAGTSHLLHDTFNPADDPARRRAAMAEHMDGALFAPSIEHYAKLSDPFLEDGGRTLAKGNCFEIGRCYFWEKFSQQTQAPTDADQILAGYRPWWTPKPEALWTHALQAWIGSLSEPMSLKMDWRDRFYLEQRLGGWLSANQMYPDIFDSTNFYAGNSLWIFDLLLRLDPAKRESGAAQREIISAMAPQLLDLPINPVPFKRWAKNQARVLVRRIKTLVRGHPAGAPSPGRHTVGKA
jgi:hypothetical protein